MRKAFSGTRTPLVLTVALAVACGDGPIGPGSDGLEFVAGAALADTILARPTQALTIRLSRDGGPVSGAVVRFQAIREDGFGMGVQVAPLEDNLFGFTSVDTTDASGEAFTRVRFGTTAGEQGIVVSVPALGHEDTAWYTVLPGAAARVAILPWDTALAVGTSYAPKGLVTDTWGNTRPGDRATFSSPAPGLQVGSSGRVSVTHVGRHPLIGTFLDIADTAWVSAVPVASIVTSDRDYATITVSSLDGSSSDVIAVLPTQEAHWPAWLPDGSALIIQRGLRDRRQLYRLALNGGASTLIPSSPLQDAGRPQVGRNGWIYFEAREPGDAALGVWRVRVDGSELTRVAPSATLPSPAPDGTRLAAVGAEGLVVIDVQSGRTTALGTEGTLPLWSPAGGRIAFMLDSRIHLIAPDGSNLRVLSNDRYGTGMTWSPDGHWLVVVTGQGLKMVSAETGEAIPLPHPHSVLQPSWRP